MDYLRGNRLETRISRRSLLRGGAVGTLGLTTAAMIGCDDDDDDEEESAAPAASGAAPPAASSPAPAAAAPEAAKGIKFVTGHPQKPPNMDPNTSALASAESYGIYDTLTRVLRAPGGGVVGPGIAHSWATDPNDKTTWVFNLEQAEWSDGTPFSAADVVFTFQYYGDPDNKSRLISRVSTVESIKALDDRTVAITTKGTDPILGRRVALPFLLPKHIFEDPSIDVAQLMGSSPVGTGAYVVKEFVSDTSVSLEKSPSSWRGTQGIDAPETKWISETTTRIAAYETGEIDYVVRIPELEVERIGGLENTKIGAAPPTSMVQWAIGDRPQESRVVNDGRVRQALNYALDRDTISDVVYNGVSKPGKDQLITSPVFGHNPDLKQVPYDPDRARELLKDAGLGDGFSMSIESPFGHSPGHKPMTEASVGYWQDIGIESSIKTIELNIWRDWLYGRATAPWPDAITFTWSSFLFEASFAMTWFDSENAHGVWSNPDFDAPYRAALVELDEEARRQLYWEASETMRVENEGPSAFMVEATQTEGWRSDILPADFEPWSFPNILFDSVRPA
jgi:peptide/nickel transport system substrate-binding protein